MRQIAATWPVRRHVTALGTGRLGRVGALHAALLCVAGCLWAMAVSHASGQEAATSESTEAESTKDAAAKKLPAMLEPDKGWLRVTKDYEVWIDFQKKQVIAGGRICLREGLLEMFACPKGTKEHESIVSVHTPARYVHAALVALGAQPGPAVQFEPTYKPAQGTEITLEVLWKGNGRARGRAPSEGTGMGQAREDGQGTGIPVGVRRERVLDRRRGQGTVLLRRRR